MEAIPNVAFQTILALVASGFFVVEADGSVWRTKKRTWAGKERAIAKRRADPIGTLGYRYVKVQIEKRQYAVPAHRLVWHVLVGQIPDGLEVNHKKGNRADNRPEMLELVTSGENKAHAYSELNRPRPGSPKFSEEERLQVISLRKNGSSYRSIEKQTRVSAAAARAICRKAAGGSP